MYAVRLGLLGLRVARGVSVVRPARLADDRILIFPRLA
jgi:hypothetical protein